MSKRKFEQIITIKMRWPHDSFGFDVSQITDKLELFLCQYLKHEKFDCGSGRSVEIERSKTK